MNSLYGSGVLRDVGRGVASHVILGRRRTKGGAELGTEKQLFPRDPVVSHP